MAVTAGDIKWYLTGAATDGGAQADPDASLGGFRSATEITDNVTENLYDNVAGADAAAGDTEYRAYCIKNTSGQTWSAVRHWIDTNTPSGDTTIWFAVEAPDGQRTTDGGVQTIANEDAAPNVNQDNCSDWSQVANYATGIPVSQGYHDANLDTTEHIFIWLKRIVDLAASAYDDDSVIPKIQGETGA